MRLNYGFYLAYGVGNEGGIYSENLLVTVTAPLTSLSLLSSYCSNGLDIIVMLKAHLDCKCLLHKLLFLWMPLLLSNSFCLVLSFSKMSIMLWFFPFFSYLKMLLIIVGNCCYSLYSCLKLFGFWLIIRFWSGLGWVGVGSCCN